MSSLKIEEPELRLRYGVIASDGSNRCLALSPAGPVGTRTKMRVTAHARPSQSWNACRRRPARDAPASGAGAISHSLKE